MDGRTWTAALLLAGGLNTAGIAPADSASLREVYAATSAAVVTVFTREVIVLVDETPRIAKVEHEAAGVIISTDGDLLTAAHLVETADRIAVKLRDGRVLPARVVASEPAADIALLRLEELPEAVAVARLGDSDRMEVGDDIFIIGAPHGVERYLSVGRLSARSRPDQVGADLTLGEFFATDAHISAGVSGGPMFNTEGEIIGIATHLLGQEQAGPRVGFGVTSNAARRLLLEQRSFWGGFRGRWLTGLLAQAFNVPRQRGLLVERIAKNAHSPAALLGLRAGTLAARIGGVELVAGGDIILAIQGVSLEEEDGYPKARERLASLGTGDTVTMEIVREGEIVQLSAAIPAPE
ncbi:trypsin family protein [Sulfurifustis variabilis]|uniref:Trypsin family protein n=1 Tax=Sulfurifustis variabilis TaxID=1675686 RepID=A0A1B4V2P3_9GAMM|nr:trypsin-like peptidase domain-containing protein [Sulfurifustis variabilis]BAU47809.1 trypsin family protein [Sulfurifustis variabilis]